MVQQPRAQHPIPVIGRHRLAVTMVALTAVLALAACNSASISDGLQPRANVATAGQSPQPVASVGSTSRQSLEPTAMAQSTTTSPAGQQVAAVPRVDPVAFLPVTGAPQSVVTRLANSMRSAAQNASLPVVVSIDRGAKYQIKGYFSALGDGSGTTLVYVWDVLDRNGVRIHRISGQEHAPPSSGDPWDAINVDVINRVSESTIESLSSWMSRGNAG